jgi:hypothetical protein
LLGDNKVTSKKVFTFWEPRGAIHPYLELCQETWKIHLSEYEIVRLDYSNLDGYIEFLEKYPNFKKLTLPMQKDAIQVAVLLQHGGIFLDADTIILRNLTPILDYLNRSELVMLNAHMAFMAAKKNSLLLSHWYSEILTRILELGKIEPTNLDWDYIGNQVLTKVIHDLVITDQCLKFKNFRNREKSVGKEANNWQRSEVKNEFKHKLVRKKQSAYFKIFCRKSLVMLNRDKYGFIQEDMHIKNSQFPANEKYLNFWFDENFGIENILATKPFLIGLHNSWTPQWYKNLSKSEVLAHNCLLSRFLRYAITV